MGEREIRIMYLMKMLDKAKTWSITNNPFGIPSQIVVGILNEALIHEKEALENERKAEPAGGSQTD